MIGLNTRRGNVEAGDNGVAAIIGREAEAREYIDEAIDYAAAQGAQVINLSMGGRFLG
jgi:hydroxypyruvate isomerase